ncbi:MAG: hypothetical protein LBT58_01970 [Endomicrobium sp.]|nr:hypothetical protein [Endomicrobium sp.]
MMIIECDVPKNRYYELSKELSKLAGLLNIAISLNKFYRICYKKEKGRDRLFWI